MENLTTANAKLDEMSVERDIESHTIPVPFQTPSAPSTVSISGQGRPVGRAGFGLSINRQRLAQAEFDRGADAFGERNREALTELAKW